MALTVRLKKASKIYYEGDVVAGLVKVSSPNEMKHDGIILQMEGIVNLQLSSKNVGIFETFYNSIKPMTLISQTVELAAPGKIPAGDIEIPFEIPLRPRQAVSPGYPGLLETYHGVFVSVMYVLNATMKRSFLNKPLNVTCEFVVQTRQKESVPRKPVRCLINPQSIRLASNLQEQSVSMPTFNITAQLDSTVCSLDQPFTGHICVHECSVPIKSIEIQLVRVETCGCAEGYSRDATEIQNIQVGEGDICRGLEVPIHMILPRLFTCPTTTTVNFNIEFEVNIAVIFQDDYLVTENFPILLVRAR